MLDDYLAACEGLRQKDDRTVHDMLCMAGTYLSFKNDAKWQYEERLASIQLLLNAGFEAVYGSDDMLPFPNFRDLKSQEEETTDV